MPVTAPGAGDHKGRRQGRADINHHSSLIACAHVARQMFAMTYDDVLSLLNMSKR
jgi:hypothetical protein